MGKKVKKRNGARYSKAFKKDAVALYLDGRSYAQVAREVGVNVNTIRQWVADAQESAEEAPSVPDDVMAELRRLRKRVAELEEDKVILKKAAAFFAKEST